MNPTDSRVKAFLESKSLRDLAHALDEPYKRFTFLVYARNPDTQYKTFNISKLWGKTREICAPTTALKHIQTKLASILAKIYRPYNNAHAFIMGRSIVSNAKPHLKAETIIKIDLVDFFGSINFGRIMHLFMAKPFFFNRDIAISIARIACKDGKLPQGSPLSPVISNMICLKLDAQLNRFAANNRCTYTRYADDITLSTQSKPPGEFAECLAPLQLGTKLDLIIMNNGFVVNNAKLSMRSGNDAKYITGVKVNSKLNVARSRVREVRAMIHAYRKYGDNAALKEHYDKWTRRVTSNMSKTFVEVILGKIGFISMIKGENDPVVINLRVKLEEATSLYSKTMSSNPELQDKYAFINRHTHCAIYTEGKTDRFHLKAALARLHRLGLFTELRLLFYSWPWNESGVTILENIAKSARHRLFSEVPTLLLFDRDITDKEKDKYTTGLVGNNIWSMLLPIPSHRADWDKSISIEHFYTDETLYHLDTNGRRLYTANEFNKATLLHHTEDNIKLDKKIFKQEYSVLERVIRTTDGSNVCLSKREFSRMIALEKFRLTETDTTSFIPLFTEIQELINKHKTLEPH